MELKLYVIWDAPAKEASAPFVAKTISVAKRMFEFALKKVAHSEDYSLYCIGSFDSDSMVCVGWTPTLVKVDIGEELDDE